MSKRKAMAVVSILLIFMECHAIDFTASHSVNSAYVFRGLVVNDEWVYQPYLDFAFDSGLYGWLWGNMDLTDNRGYPSYEFSECDLGVGYAIQMEKLAVSFEYAEYLYPSVDFPSTREVFLRFSYDTVFQPTFTFARDIGEADGFYMMVSFSENLFSGPSVSLDATTSFGWADAGYLDYYFGYEHGAALDGNLGLSISKRFSTGISVSANVQYTWVIGDDALSTNAQSWYEYDNLVWGGLTISHGF